METQQPQLKLEIRLAIGKLILSHSKIRYMIPIVQTNTTHLSFYGMLTLRQCGQSGLTPTRHEYRIFRATPDDATIGEVLERDPVVFRTTPQTFMFLSRDQAQLAAQSIISLYAKNLNE